MTRLHLEDAGLEDQQKRLLLVQQKLNEYKQAIADFNQVSPDVKITYPQE